MSLTDYLKRKRDEPVRVIPATEEEPGTELMPMPILAYKNDRDQPLKTITAPIVPVKEREKPEWKKPPGMFQEDWEAAINVFSPQRVNELYRGFDPQATEPFYQQLYRSVHREIKEPDEKKINSARNIASLGDALSLIAQAVGASQGSFIDIRKDSASQRTDAGIERLKAAYKQDRDNYDAGMLDAIGRDVEGGKKCVLPGKDSLA